MILIIETEDVATAMNLTHIQEPFEFLTLFVPSINTLNSSNINVCTCSLLLVRLCST